MSQSPNNSGPNRSGDKGGKPDPVAAKLERERRLELEEFLLLQKKLSEQVSEARDTLNGAMLASEQLAEQIAGAQNKLKRAIVMGDQLRKRAGQSRFFAEVNLERRYRLKDSVHMIATSHQVATRAHRALLNTSRQIRESVDELVSADSQDAFEVSISRFIGER